MGLIAAAARGAVAGAVATAAMDAVWFRRYRAGGGDQRLLEWEFSAPATDFGEDAPAPARVANRIADAAGVSLPPSAVGPANNIVHWMTGVGWGKAAGVAAALIPAPALAVGVATGLAAWTTSYAVLGKLGIYRPITEYDRQTLAQDLSAHVVFGTTLGLALTATGAHRR